LLLVLFALTILPAVLPAQTAETSGKPFVVDIIYKAKWGSRTSSCNSSRKPLPSVEDRLKWPHGQSLDGPASLPHHRRRPLGLSRHHVFKNSTVANEPFDEDAMKKQLWPDQATYQKEEQRRFENTALALGSAIRTVDLEGK